jgi:hypothetical protein
MPQLLREIFVVPYHRVRLKSNADKGLRASERTAEMSEIPSETGKSRPEEFADYVANLARQLRLLAERRKVRGPTFSARISRSQSMRWSSVRRGSLMRACRSSVRCRQ